MALDEGKDGASWVGASDVDLSGLRVVICTSNYDGKSDGVTLTMNRVVRHIRSLGARVLLCTLRYSEPEVVAPDVSEVDEVVYGSMYVQGASGYLVGLYSNEIEEAMERFRPHLMHFVSPCPMSCACLRWARHRGLPVVSSYHTNFPFLFSSHFLLSPFTTAVRNIISWSYGGMCDRVLVPTRTTLEELVRDEGLDRRKLLVWGRGVETNHFGTRYRCVEERRRLRGLEHAPEGVEDDGKPVLLLVSRLVPEKNLAAVSETLVELRRRGVPHHAVIVGTGSHEGWMKERCPPETRFLGHVRDLALLGRIYASADVFFFPSIFETFGRVTIEAMASGLPVVAGRGGGSMDIVHDGEDGFLVEATDIEAMVKRCTELLTDADLRSRMSAAAVRTAATFQWGPIMDLLVDTYKDAIAEVATKRALDRWEDVAKPKTPPPGLEGFTALDEDGGFIRWATSGRWAVGGWDEGVEGGAAPAAADSSVLWWLGGGMWEGIMGGRVADDEPPSFLACASRDGGKEEDGSAGGGGEVERETTPEAAPSPPPQHFPTDGQTGVLGQPKKFTGSDDDYGPIASIFAAWFGTEQTEAGEEADGKGDAEEKAEATPHPTNPSPIPASD